MGDIVTIAPPAALSITAGERRGISQEARRARRGSPPSKSRRAGPDRPIGNTALRTVAPPLFGDGSHAVLTRRAVANASRHTKEQSMTSTLALALAMFAGALAAVAPLGAQGMQDISAEYRPARNETFVRMKKLPLDNENQIGAFYVRILGHTQKAPANEVTVHVVHSGAAWAYAAGYDVVVVLDGIGQPARRRARSARRASARGSAPSSSSSRCRGSRRRRSRRPTRSR